MLMDKYFYFPSVGLPTGMGLDLPLSSSTTSSPSISLWDDFVSGSITVGQAYISATTTTTLAVAAVTTSEPGGAITITGSAAAGNAGIRTAVPMRISSGKAFVYTARLKSATITDGIYVGMEAGNANPFTSTNCKGAFFYINAADIRYGVLGSAGGALGTGTTISSGQSLVANTYVDLSICWTGSEACFFVNGVLVGKVTTASPVGCDLYPVLGTQYIAAAKTITVDYHGFQLQR